MCYNNTIRPETREAGNLMSTREQGRDLKQGTMRRPRDKSFGTSKLTTTAEAYRLHDDYDGTYVATPEAKESKGQQSKAT